MSRDVVQAEPGTFVVENAVALLNRKIEGPRWLVENYVPEGGCTVIVGEPKVGKSFLAMDLALAVVAGSEFLGQPADAGEVLVFDAETQPQELKLRLKKMLEGRGIEHELAERLNFVHGQRLKIDDPGPLERLRATVQDLAPRLIILDCLKEFTDREENSNTEMGMVLSELRDLTRICGSTLVLVHHAGKPTDRARSVGQLLRGASAIQGWFDALIRLGWDGSERFVEFQCRYCAPMPKLNLNFVDHGHAQRFEVLGNSAYAALRADEVLEAIKQSGDQGMTVRAVRDELGAGQTTVTRAITELKSKGAIELRRTSKMDYYRYANRGS